MAKAPSHPTPTDPPLLCQPPFHHILAPVRCVFRAVCSVELLGEVGTSLASPVTMEGRDYLGLNGWPLAGQVHVPQTKDSHMAF